MGLISITKETTRTRIVTTCNTNRRKRRMTSSLASMKNQQEFKKGLPEEYDEVADHRGEELWGDHIHLGFYEPTKTNVSVRSAQTRLIEEALRFASISEDPAKKPRSMVDVGCGKGSSSRLLAKKYGATVQGFTISPVEIERAKVLTEAQGLADKVSSQVADALNQPFADGTFDLVWSLESAEHMPDKEKFVSELARVAAPGGTIIILPCCQRDLSPTEESLPPKEKELLNKITKAFHITEWSSSADYGKLLQSNSLQEIKVADWSENVAPFFLAHMKSVLTWKGLITMIRTRFKLVKYVLLMPLMLGGYRKGVLRYNIITCRKPA